MREADDTFQVTRHDFSQWADGRSWEAVRGEDFTGTPEGYRTAIHRWAGRNGYVARVSLLESGAIVKFRLTPAPPEIP